MFVSANQMHNLVTLPGVDTELPGDDIGNGYRAYPSALSAAHRRYSGVRTRPSNRTFEVLKDELSDEERTRRADL